MPYAGAVRPADCQESVMTVLNRRAPRSAVLSSAVSHSFVAIPYDEEHVARNHSCTPERLRS